MSLKFFHPTQFMKGTIKLPASKSESNRSLIIQSLCKGSFAINNLSDAEDTQILNDLLNSNKQKLDVGHAGTVMRFLTSYLSIQEDTYVLNGSDRMKERPIKGLVDALKSLGANISYLEKVGYPPLSISGRSIQGGKVKVLGGVSSQYISALLLIAPLLEKGLTIEIVGNIVSRSYIKMTISLMRYFGISVDWAGNSIKVQNGKYHSKDINIESDWSAASYWYSLAVFSDKADIQLLGLRKQSNQGDSVARKIYEEFGVRTTFNEKGVRIEKTDATWLSDSPFIFDFTDCPDLAQTIAVTCAGLNKKSRLTGLKTLRIKETDRISAIKNELNKLGYNVMMDDDDLLIEPIDDKVLTGGVEVNTYGDHRMAMAFSPLVLLHDISILDQEVVKKSYPNFWNHLWEVGFQLSPGLN